MKDYRTWRRQLKQRLRRDKEKPRKAKGGKVMSAGDVDMWVARQAGRVVVSVAK